MSSGNGGLPTYEGPSGEGILVQAYTTENETAFHDVLEPYLAELRDRRAELDLAVPHVYQSFLRPPNGRGERKVEHELKQSVTFNQELQGKTLQPKFDHVLFLRFGSVDAARAAREDAGLHKHADALAAASSDSHVAVYENRVRVGTVSDSYDEQYLFNFFYTDQMDSFEDTWRNTSAWFFKHTNLRSSYVCRDVEPGSRFPFINYAHWDSVGKLIEEMIVRRSFKKEVMEPFRENRMLPTAILYHRADL